jgi:hypothetical protein
VDLPKKGEVHVNLTCAQTSALSDGQNGSAFTSHWRITHDVVRLQLLGKALFQIAILVANLICA